MSKDIATSTPATTDLWATIPSILDNPNRQQLCRTELHECVPAVTLTWDDGTVPMYFCTNHAHHADRYANIPGDDGKLPVRKAAA
jgi:hypothetical protein